MHQQEDLSWDKGVYLPPGEKVTVSFKLTYDYNDAYPRAQRDNMDKASKWANRRLKEVDGFAILGRANRYQIIFPRGWEATAEK